MKNALSKAALTRTLPRLRAHMGKSAANLDQLLTLLTPDGSINLATALTTLYPSVPQTRALANLRQLRSNIKKAAQKSAINIQLSGDKKTRTPAADQSLWFEGDDHRSEAIEQQVKPNLTGPPRSQQDAIRLGPKRIYVDYSENDSADAQKLIDLLIPHGRALDFELWHHNLVLPGENTAEERRRQRQQSDLTLQLLTPRFQAERRHEDPTPRPIPVLLQSIANPPTDLAIFPHDAKCFSAQNKNGQRDFALNLAQQIHAILHKPSPDREDFFQRLAHHGVNFVPGAASSVSLQQEVIPTESHPDRRDALTLLTEWFDEPKAPPYCALFGETGMGKTTTAKEFASQLWRRSRPAIFLDLRFIGDYATKDPDLDQIITRILNRDWKGGPRNPTIEPKDIYQTVEQGGLIIFDGLDEVLVHLTPSQGQLFTRQLFRIRPPSATQGKLLITCRTQYFRTFKEQASHFRLEDREDLAGESYRALLLLPFEAAQIKTYLQNSLSPEEASRAYDFISTVHNLPELAQRPYTLNLITRQLTKLEEWKAAGNPVTGLTLYRFVVEEWLLRDQGKHQLTPDHKQMIMEEISAALTRSGVRSWSAKDLEQWLIDFLEANPRVTSHYHGIHRDLLKEDLRTATFLARDKDQFRFAHSSLQEYFLAHYLRRSLEEKHFSNWALKGVSSETLDFLGQSLREQPSPSALQALALLRDTYLTGASELAFRYVLLAQSKNFPSPVAAGFQLPGADLFGLEVDHALDLSNINLKGARIANTFWRNCRFTNADFSNADASRSEWLDCDLTSSKWQGAELEAALFRQCKLERSDFAESRRYRTRYLRCSGVESKPGPEAELKQLNLGHSGSVNGCAWSPDSQRVLSASDDYSLKIWDAASGECLRNLNGHSNSVSGCTWSPNGQRVLSASWDNSLKIWDAASGACLRTLSGHSAFVNGCAWSPDSQRILSASYDNSLKIWDAASGECVRTLSGHSSSVLGCAWSPDSQRVLSASDDAGLKIWDAASGECVHTLSGHSSSVLGCAWSPDSQRVLSASDDSLKIWDAASGECLRTLRGHASSVYGCAWSPDSQLVVSASDDNTLKIWDPASGECLRTLSGHSSSVWGCAWSPDSRRVVSASRDKSLKIWDPTSGDSLRILSGHSRSVFGCAWSPGSQRVVSASWDESLKIWDAASGDCLRTLSGHVGVVDYPAWSPDGQKVLSASADQTLKIWDAETGECLHTLSGHSDVVDACAWSPDNRKVVSASWDASLKIWDAASGQCLRTLSGHSQWVTDCSWSLDGQKVVSASWDDSLKIWDAASGECLRTLRGHSSPVRGCAWSPDSQLVASASLDRRLKIWDATTGECVQTLSGHSEEVTGCTWSPDNQRVVSASSDNTLKIWDTENGECLHTRLTLQTPRACQWSTCNTRIIACFDDGSLRFYSADTLTEIGHRCYHLHAPHCEPSWATVDLNGHVLHHGPDAWRSVGYVVPDESGIPMWLPVEAVE